MAFLIQPSSTKSAFGALPGRKIASSGPNICSSAVSSSISCAENQTVTEATIRYLPGLKDEEQNLSARRNFYPALEAKCITERLGGLPGLVSLPAGPTAGIFRHGTQDFASLARYMGQRGEEPSHENHYRRAVAVLGVAVRGPCAGRIGHRHHAVGADRRAGGIASPFGALRARQPAAGRRQGARGGELDVCRPAALSLHAGRARCN